MKKPGTKTVSVKDRISDILFHFHQELPRLLVGYHQCTRKEAVLRGALIYRVNIEQSKQELAVPPQILWDLVPCDIIKTQSSQD